VTAGFLLDTVVVSALAPDRRDVLPPEKAVARAWSLGHEARLFLPATAIAEIAAGIGGRRRAARRRWRRGRAIGGWGGEGVGEGSRGLGPQTKSDYVTTI